MAGIFNLVYSQDFISVATIDIIHNRNCEYLKVKVIVNGESREDLIKNIITDVADPTNMFIIQLLSEETGTVQVFETDFVSVGELSSSMINNIGLQDYYYAGDDEEMSTTSTEWVDRLNLSVDILNAGVYRLNWYFTWWYSHTNSTAVFRILVDYDTVISSFFVNTGGSYSLASSLVNISKRKELPLCGFRPINLSSGVHNVTLQMRSSKSFRTITVYQAWLEAQRVLSN